MGIRVLLVDDHKMLREGIKQLIEFDPAINVYGEASNASECKKIVSSVFFDVIVLDINLPDTSGLELVSDIRKSSKDSKILILTLHNETEYLVDAMDKGVDGYILKDAGSDELITAIKKVYSGERYIQTDLLPALNSALLKHEDELGKSKILTKREKQMLYSIASGKSNKDIAAEYDISERTVKNHISNLFKKIDVSDRTQAAVFAIRNNIISV